MVAETTSCMLWMETLISVRKIQGSVPTRTITMITELRVRFFYIGDPEAMIFLS
jgi:hypothetical protein